MARVAPPGTEALPLALAGTAAGSFLTLALLDESAKVWGPNLGQNLENSAATPVASLPGSFL